MLEPPQPAEQSTNQEKKSECEQNWKIHRELLDLEQAARQTSYKTMLQTAESKLGEQERIDHEHSSLWEMKILARILLDNAVLRRPAFASLEAEDFRDDRNMLIFATMKCLAREGREIDLVSLADQLHRYGDLENAGGAPYLASLVELLDRV